MKTKDKPMRMQWVMLILTIGIAISNVNSTVWQWVICVLCAILTFGLFIADAWRENKMLEYWESENQKFESECEEMVKNLEAKGFNRVKGKVMAFQSSTGLLLLLGSGMDQSTYRCDTFLVETKDRLRLVSAENYVVVFRNRERASSLVLER